uniref:Sugar phosphate exchanger 3 n=1 Tax=Callorhinchus milii TaxID=7868 RepID=A0A4W3H5U6_CALMI
CRMMTPTPRRGFLSQFTHHHASVFLLTFVSYALFHATRKTFSNVKVSISNQWIPSFRNSTTIGLHPDQIWNKNHLFADAAEATLFLGFLDTLFLFAYAVGLYISGFFGDRLNPRLILSFGMCLSALVMFLFGTVLEWFHLYNKYLYCFLWILVGLLQSTGWPCVVAILGNWFGKAGRGFLFGIWSACASVGNILGAFLVASVLKFGYEYAFLVTNALLFAGGVVVFFGLLSSPKEVGKYNTTAHRNEYLDQEVRRPLMDNSFAEDYCERNHTVQESSTAKPPPIGFLQACCLPGVLLYSLAYACVKLVNYSFFFWLPFYLHSKFNWKEEEADRLSIWYDVGGILGGMIQGLISDILHKRAPVLAVSLILAIGALVGYSRKYNVYILNAVLMAFTGFSIGGPSNLISSAISTDLGRQEQIRGHREALASVVGIIDGTGSVGAAVGQFLVSLIQHKLGWMWVFHFFILMTALTIVCIFPLIVREMSSLFRRHPSRTQ